jgi:hypothetical protein
MRLDPKYFNHFLGGCAVVTVFVIFFFTVLYVSGQQETLREEIEKADLNDWKLYHYTTGDSLSISQFSGRPVIIHFWSTWSDMSMSINDELQERKLESDDLVVIAAAARDGEEQVKEYINSVPYDFVYVNGTALYQGLMVPGLPSQLYVNRDGEIVDHLVGNDPEKRDQKIQSLMEQN